MRDMRGEWEEEEDLDGEGDLVAQGLDLLVERGVVFCVVLLWLCGVFALGCRLFASVGDEHDAAGGAFGGAGGAEGFFAADKDVRVGGVFAEDGDVAEDVDGADVAGEDDEALFAFAQGFDDFLDAALDVAARFRRLLGELEELLAHLGLCERLGDGGNVVRRLCGSILVVGSRIVGSLSLGLLVLLVLLLLLGGCGLDVGGSVNVHGSDLGLALGLLVLLGFVFGHLGKDVWGDGRLLDGGVNVD